MQPTRGRDRLLALLAVLVLLTTACAGKGTTEEGGSKGDSTETGGKIEERVAGGVLVYGADQEPTGFNGNTLKDNGSATVNIIQNLHYFAVKARPDFGLEFVGLEEEPKIVSDDPQTVEWTIKKNAVWSDDTPVTTDDIKYFFETMEAKDPAKVTEDNPKGYLNEAASHVGYDQITKFEAVDSQRFRATFEPTYGDFRGLWQGIAQAKFMQAQPGGWNTGLDNHPGPSSGPYVFREYVKGESLTLDKNPKWWGDVKPTLESIVFRFLPESRTQPDALRNSEVDFIYPQPQGSDLVDQVKQLTDVKSEVNFGPTFEHLTFNFQNEFLKDLAVRQAIAHAVDRNVIVEALMKPFDPKAARLDNRVLVATQRGYEAHGDMYRKVDRAKAEKVLTDAGYAKGGDGIFTKDGKRLSLRISTTSGNLTREQQGELIKAQLAEVGIEIRIDNSPFAVLFSQRLPDGDFDIANFAWVGSVFPLSAAKQIYGTGGESNYGAYSNPEFDNLAKDAAAELDDDEQLKLADKQDVVMWKDLPNLPLYQKPTFIAVRNKFVNIKDNTTNEGPFWNSQVFGLRKAVQ